ncbi:hypothetical protein QM467_04895 [Rhodoblastus sp. 17X3]|uniref:hypothetical protein n=1 Tax=Rhodoblastus sp. 17X3 TaxID=3047026 RepID=UPI0024B7F4DF|nr:hypothetical protein [Rhodoblastus sp. 17X3]MDI9847398.1 hypothetical protein [Rhodoblastus sp. 17X3]
MPASKNQMELTHINPLRRRRRAPNCSAKLTAELASKVKTMVLEMGMAQHTAAAKLNLNPGRVNEVVHGNRFQDAPFAPVQDVIAL